MTVRGLADPLRWLFADPSLPAHLARGAIGFCAIVLALAPPWRATWPALMLLPLALMMLRGCPMCWLYGTLCAIQAPPAPPTATMRNPDVPDQLYRRFRFRADTGAQTTGAD